MKQQRRCELCGANQYTRQPNELEATFEGPVCDACVKAWKRNELAAHISTTAGKEA